MLLAKPNVTLKGHSFDVLASWEAFSESRLGMAWKRFFGLSDQEWEIYCLNMRVSGLLHDVGKCGVSFQDYIQGRAAKQPFRHEHLSLVILLELEPWIRLNPLLNFDFICTAVVGHHLKVQRGDDISERYPLLSPRGTNHCVELLLKDPEVDTILQKIAAIAGLPSPPTIKRTHWDYNSAPDQRFLRRAYEINARIELITDPKQIKLLLAYKAGLILADSLGSGLIRNDLSIRDWVGKQANLPPPLDEIRKIIDARVASIGEAFHGFTEVQERAKRASHRAVIVSSCNSGKTLAAYRWIESMTLEYSCSRAIFTYPTCATATEGYFEYASKSESSTLVHHRAEFDLAAKLDEGGLTELKQRLFSLGHWTSTIFSTTCDQFFGFLSLDYGSLCLLPLVSDGVLVVDELHAWDERMFSLLLSFIEMFPHIPILCMTATCKPQRVRELQKRGFDLIQEGASDTQATVPKYQVTQVSKSICFDRAVDYFHQGFKTLWVVNTVPECQLVAEQLMSLGIKVLLYHSRYEDRHRKYRHREAISAFEIGSAPVVVVTTQVCEMSLDLRHCQALITELCPMSAFIQRLGRALRTLLERGEVAPILVYSREGEPQVKNPYLPYSSEEFRIAREFLRGVGTGVLSQQDLLRVFEKLDEANSAGIDPDVWSPALAPTIFSDHISFRDIPDLVVSCVLEEELESDPEGGPGILELIESGRQWKQHIIPVLAPRNSGRGGLYKPDNSTLPRYLYVSPRWAHEYSPMTGYKPKGS